MKNYETIDEYISDFPKETQKKLTEMRKTIQKQAPQAAEKISYQMPTFYLNGNLVHFAGYAKHIGFYPTSTGIRAFEGALAAYKHAKGSVQFPLEKPLPTALIRKIVKFRIKENMHRRK